MSTKQMEANRQNARKSTGPRTPAGRARSRMNALKHGIRSKGVLVQGLHYRENSRELDALYERFRQEMDPQGPVEEMLVDQIVTAHWRWRRALAAESGEIALSVDDEQKRHDRPVRRDEQWRRWEASDDVLGSMENSLLGCSVLEAWLCKFRAEVERAGEITATAVQEAERWFRDRPNHLTRALEALRLELLENPEGLAEAAWRERNQQRMRAFLDGRLAGVARLRLIRLEEEEQEEATRQAAALLPRPAVLDKILRYETALERQLFRAMNQLERLQRRRQGEEVPAAWTMEVSARA